MRTRTTDFKNQIKEMGREIDSRITFDDNTFIDGEKLFSVKPILNAELLKSTMKGFTFESSEDLDIDTRFKYQFGLLVNDSYEYLDFGYYYIHEKEYNEDSKHWTYTCYDKLRLSMVEYKGLSNGTFPMTVRSYINNLCTDLGITFANSSDTFTNYDKVIEADPYIDANGDSLGYLYRDLFDELSAVVAGNLCINNDDELEVRYVNKTESSNLISIANATGSGNGINASFTENNTLTIVGTNTKTNANYAIVWPNINYSVFPDFKPGEVYTISTVNTLSKQDAYLQINYYRKETGVQVALSTLFLNNKKTTFTIPNDFDRVAIIFLGIARTCGEIDFTTNIKLEKGNQATSYEPYGLDQVDEEYLKDVNVKFGEKFGPLNTVILSRSADADVIYQSYPENLPEEDRKAFKIVDNQIMNGNDRADYLSEILNKLKGLEFYINDYTSTGIMYYELLDLYNVKVEQEDDEGNLTTNTYKCLMLNDEPEISDGLVEKIFTPLPEVTETDYENASKDDRTLSQVYIIARKNEGRISAVVSQQNSLEQRVSSAELTLDSQGARLDIATTNIDPLTGDITSLKTTSYELSEEGFIIDDGSGYKSIDNTTGKYYYDNDTMIGKYTKDGSVQKDFALFGRYYYGIDENLDVENFTKDDAMFVAQLYEDGNNEEAFGHFYNGGGN